MASKEVALGGIIFFDVEALEREAQSSGSL